MCMAGVCHKEGLWPSWWIKYLWQVCSVSGATFPTFFATFPKQNILILSQNISDFKLNFCMSKFFQKNKFVVVVDLEGLKV